LPILINIFLLVFLEGNPLHKKKEQSCTIYKWRFTICKYFKNLFKKSTKKR